MEPSLRAVVDHAIRDATDRTVVPRFRTLEAKAITEKSPGDWVTDADHECEELLTAALQSIEPGVPVVGEEAVAADPSLLATAHKHDRAWVLDPVDGTKEFIDGSPDFATMVALVEGGITTASWIWQPIHGQMFAAVGGAGATRNGRPLEARRDQGPREQWRGLLRTRAMPAALRTASDASLERAGLHHTHVAAAGVTYPLAATGEFAYALYWRTLPWDHAPGALLAQEAGLTIQRLDGTPYRPFAGGPGLLTAATPEVWATVRDALPADLQN
ncbi:MAG: inositol monophosphatase family protein [Actinomycetia bacterium]|nr:inositol monophosphatase family protein [Actinomycetes bacterium]